MNSPSPPIFRYTSIRLIVSASFMPTNLTPNECCSSVCSSTLTISHTPREDNSTVPSATFPPPCVAQPMLNATTALTSHGSRNRCEVWRLSIIAVLEIGIRLVTALKKNHGSPNRCEISRLLENDTAYLRIATLQNSHRSMLKKKRSTRLQWCCTAPDSCWWSWWPRPTDRKMRTFEKGRPPPFETFSASL